MAPKWALESRGSGGWGGREHTRPISHYIIPSIVQSNPTERPGLYAYFCPLGASWACPSGLLGLPGPQHCLPGPQYCLSWPAGRQLHANWTPIGRQLDAKWAPSWTVKTAASVNVRLKDAKTAAKSHRTPCQQYFCRRMATYAALVYTHIYIYIYRGGRSPPIIIQNSVKTMQLIYFN